MNLFARVLGVVALVAGGIACAPAATPTPAPTMARPIAPTLLPAVTREATATPGITLLQRESDIAALAVDDANVYWATCKTTAATGRIAKLAKSSGAVAALASEVDCPTRLSVDAGNIYWMSGKKILRADKEGKPALPLASADGDISGFVLDDSSIYYSFCEQGAGALAKISGQDHANRTVLKENKCPQITSADAASIYYSTYDREAGHELYRVTKSGGAPEKIATLARYPIVVGSLVADETTIYWTTRQDPGKPQGDADDYNSILALSMETRAVRSIADQQARPSALALDAANLYWSNCGTLRFNFENAALMRASKTPTVLPVPFIRSVCATQLALDATHIYFVTKDGINRIKK